MRMRTRSLLVALGTIAALAIGAAPAQAATVVLNQGHADVIGVAYEEGELHVHVHDETVEPGVEREPCDVIIEVKSSAQLAVPDDPAYSFLGDPGDPIWVLPQIEDPNLLFAGIGTEEIEPGALLNDSVKIKLAGIYGPGHFSLFTTDEFGARPCCSTAATACPTTSPSASAHTCTPTGPSPHPAGTTWPSSSPLATPRPATSSARARSSIASTFSRRESA